MSYTIGFAGKGGTGKTTIASIVIGYLAKRNGGPVLAIDADPNSNLGEMLGVEAEDTIVGIIDDISANIDKLPAGVTKERLIEQRVQQSLGEGRDVDLLIMGRAEGPGCYCYPNSMLRETIGRLERSYKFIVIDNEAGMEHISRRTDRRIDYLFLISDATLYGIRAAKKISDLANEMKITTGANHLIINRARKDMPNLDQELKNLNLNRSDIVYESKEMLDLSAKGRPTSDLSDRNEFVKSIYKICEEAGWR